jgi:hypothetical protein
MRSGSFEAVPLCKTSNFPRLLRQIDPSRPAGYGREIIV